MPRKWNCAQQDEPEDAVTAVAKCAAVQPQPHLVGVCWQGFLCVCRVGGIASAHPGSLEEAKELDHDPPRVEEDGGGCWGEGSLQLSPYLSQSCWLKQDSWENRQGWSKNWMCS